MYLPIVIIPNITVELLQMNNNCDVSLPSKYPDPHSEHEKLYSVTLVLRKCLKHNKTIHNFSSIF